MGDRGEHWGVSPQSPHKKEPKEHWDVYTTNVENQLLLGSESVVDNRRPKRCSDVILESLLEKNYTNVNIFWIVPVIIYR